MSLIVSAGGDATLCVAAFGSSLNYQWYMNGKTLGAATSPCLTLRNVTVNEVGEYWVVISNPLGNITSTRVTLTLLNPVIVGLKINGPIGSTYQIEYLDALGTTAQWKFLTKIKLDKSPYVFVDQESADTSRRFYRAIFVTPP